MSKTFDISNYECLIKSTKFEITEVCFITLHSYENLNISVCGEYSNTLFVTKLRIKMFALKE